MSNFDYEEESEATMYCRAHKSGSAGSAFGWCGSKDEDEKEAPP